MLQTPVSDQHCGMGLRHMVSSSHCLIGQVVPWVCAAPLGWVQTPPLSHSPAPSTPSVFPDCTNNGMCRGSRARICLSPARLQYPGREEKKWRWRKAFIPFLKAEHGMCIRLSSSGSIAAFRLSQLSLPAHSCTNPFCSLPSANTQAATAAQMFPIKLRAMPTNFGTHESVLRNGPPQIPFIFLFFFLFPPPFHSCKYFLNANGFHAATDGSGLWSCLVNPCRRYPQGLGGLEQP